MSLLLGGADNMTIENIPNLDDYSIWTSYAEHYTGTSSEPDYYIVDYYYSPFIVWLIIAGVLLWVIDRIYIEYKIRWRK